MLIAGILSPTLTGFHNSLRPLLGQGHLTAQYRRQHLSTMKMHGEPRPWRKIQDDCEKIVIAASYVDRELGLVRCGRARWSCLPGFLFTYCCRSKKKSHKYHKPKLFYRSHHTPPLSDACS